MQRLGYWITYSVAARKEAKEFVVNSSRIGRDEIHRARVGAAAYPLVLGRIHGLHGRYWRTAIGKERR